MCICFFVNSCTYIVLVDVSRKSTATGKHHSSSLCVVRNLFKDLSVPYEELRFKETIGRGSFGEVHRGEWNGKEVALKRINIPVGEDKYKMIANSTEIVALK